MTYANYAEILVRDGYVPMGRWEHAIKGASIHVMFLWYHPHTHRFSSVRPENLIVTCNTDNQGYEMDVTGVFHENITPFTT